MLAVEGPAQAIGELSTGCNCCGNQISDQSKFVWSCTTNTPLIDIWRENEAIACLCEVVKIVSSQWPWKRKFEESMREYIARDANKLQTWSKLEIRSNSLNSQSRFLWLPRVVSREFSCASGFKYEAYADSYQVEWQWNCFGLIMNE